MVRSVFVEEAAALLGVSRRTVYYRIKDGRLRTVRTACRTQRVLVESIHDLLRAGYRSPAGAGRQRRP
jgi:excisionase family DNA binding protein